MLHQLTDVLESKIIVTETEMVDTARLEKKRYCNYVKIGQRIEKLRKDAKISQNDLAETIGITRSALASYEAFNRDISLDTLVEIADYFGCSVDYLIGKSSVKEIKGDLAIASKYTGLSEEALKNLPYLVEMEDDSEHSILDEILSADAELVSNILYRLACIKNACIELKFSIDEATSLSADDVVKVNQTEYIDYDDLQLFDEMTSFGSVYVEDGIDKVDLALFHADRDINSFIDKLFSIDSLRAEEQTAYAHIREIKKQADKKNIKESQTSLFDNETEMDPCDKQ